MGVKLVVVRYLYKWAETTTNTLDDLVVTCLGSPMTPPILDASTIGY